MSEAQAKQLFSQSYVNQELYKLTDSLRKNIPLDKCSQNKLLQEIIKTTSTPVVFGSVALSHFKIPCSTERTFVEGFMKHLGT